MLTVPSRDEEGHGAACWLVARVVWGANVGEAELGLSTEAACLARRRRGVMAELPTGTVTLLFTDIEGSTRLLQRLGQDRYV